MVKAYTVRRCRIIDEETIAFAPEGTDHDELVRIAYDNTWREIGARNVGKYEVVE